MFKIKSEGSILSNFFPGPVPAVQKALAKASWSVDDVDVFELHEAFASQSLAVVRDLGVPAEKVNVQGGCPIGASGCRVPQQFSGDQSRVSTMFSDHHGHIYRL